MELAIAINHSKTFSELNDVITNAIPYISWWGGRVVSTKDYEGWVRMTDLFQRAIEINRERPRVHVKREHGKIEIPSSDTILGAGKLDAKLQEICKISISQLRPLKCNPVYQWLHFNRASDIDEPNQKYYMSREELSYLTSLSNNPKIIEKINNGTYPYMTNC